MTQWLNGYLTKFSQKKLSGKWFLGRPKLKRIDNVTDDLKTIEVRNWRAQASEREDLNFIVEDAKV